MAGIRINAVNGSFSPTIPRMVSSLTGSTSRTGSTVTVNTGTPHGFVVGQTINLVVLAASQEESNFPSGAKTVLGVTDADTFTYTEAGTAGASSKMLRFATTANFTTDLASDTDPQPNGLMWSPPGEPWHVPLLNQAFVGDEGATLLRVVPTRDKLVLFTTAGVFQLFGDYPNFGISELDTTISLAAYNTAVPASGRVFALSTTGVVEVDQSARVVSVPIEDALRDMLAQHGTNVALRAFAVAYESERIVAFFLPDDSTDAYCSQAFVYHLDSGQWTRWTVPATAGFIHPTQDRLYLGSDTAGVTWKERKGRVASDHQDGAAAISSVVEWAQLMPAGAGGSALVDVGSLDFQEANFATANMTFATNLSPTLSASVAVAPPAGATTGAAEVVFPMPQEQQRGTRWRVRFAHAIASERFQLQGLTLRFRPTSKRPGR